MKKLLIGIMTLTSLSAVADLPSSSDFTSSDRSVVNNLLAGPHRELSNRDCIFASLESKGAKLLIAQGYGIDSVRMIRYFSNNTQKNMIRADFWGTSLGGDRTVVTSPECALK